jgi:hypothetical protein
MAKELLATLRLHFLNPAVYIFIYYKRTGFQWGNLKEGDHLKERNVDYRIILKWRLEKWNGAK